MAHIKCQIDRNPEGMELKVNAIRRGNRERTRMNANPEERNHK